MLITADDAEIIELILNESDGSNSEFAHTKTSSPKKVVESGYCSIEDLLNIETFITQTENHNGNNNNKTYVKKFTTQLYTYNFSFYSSQPKQW